MSDFKKLLEKLSKFKEKSYMLNLLAIVLLGILLILISGIFNIPKSASVITNSNTNYEESSSSTSMSYENNLKTELKNIISKIQGVGKTELILYFESSEEQVPAYNSNKSTSETEEKDTNGGVRDIKQNTNDNSIVVANDGSGNASPVILKTFMPKVAGVCIVAEGAENVVTQLRIYKVVMDLFGLKEKNVTVMPMEK